MVKRLFSVCVLILVFCGAAFAVSKSELKRMSVFLSNFTEVRMFNFDIDSVSTAELVSFGCWHNWINNDKAVKGIGGVLDNEISAETVASSVRKYFDLPLKHKSVTTKNGMDYLYKNGNYYFETAVGEVTIYADVQEVLRKGNVIIMSGELYNAENEEEIIGEFTAEAKPYKWQGKDTWAILSLRSCFHKIMKMSVRTLIQNFVPSVSLK